MVSLSAIGSTWHDARLRWRRALKPRLLWMRLRCRGPLRAGVTVVIVNYDTLEYLRTTVGAVRRFSLPSTRIIVVDNGSTDGSVQWLRQEGLRSVALGTNVGSEPDSTSVG